MSLREDWPLLSGTALGVAVVVGQAFAHGVHFPLRFEPVLLLLAVLGFRTSMTFQVSLSVVAAALGATLLSLTPMQMLRPSAGAVLAGNLALGKMDGEAFSVAHGRFALAATLGWGTVALALHTQTAGCLLRTLMTLMTISFCFLAYSVRGAFSASSELGTRTVSRESVASLARR